MNDFMFLPSVDNLDGLRNYLTNFTKATSQCKLLNEGIRCLKEKRKFTDNGKFIFLII